MISVVTTVLRAVRFFNMFLIFISSNNDYDIFGYDNLCVEQRYTYI